MKLPLIEYRALSLVVILMILMPQAGCQPGTDESASVVLVEEVMFPALEGSGEANVAPAGSGAVASWIERYGEGGHRLRYARYDANDRAWEEASTIATGDDWFVNWADFPAIVETSDGGLLAHWLVKSGPATFAYDIFFSTRGPADETWSEPAKLHDDDTQTEHGFVSLLPLDDGSVLASWLDGRAFEQQSHRMSLRSRLLETDGSKGEEMVVDDLVCDCCQTSMAALPGGGALLVYRNRTEDEIRDIYAARFENGEWSAPQVVHEDGWQIAGCPVNGPAVSSQGSDLAAAWYSGVEESTGVFVAFWNEDGGFDPPVRVDDGRPVGRVDILMTEAGEALVTWLERNENGDGARILLKKVLRNGTTGTATTVTETSPERRSGFPRMALAGEEVVMVWTVVGSEERSVRSAVLSLDPD